jgi:cell division septal protein FtsQ
MVEGRRWGNIFLLDISQMQKRVELFSWVKGAHIRKVFPSSVNIEITAREPVALLQKDSLYLIDQEGVELEKIEPGAYSHLPVFSDEHRFIHDTQEKIALAWECLKSLPAEDRADVEILDLSAPGNVVLKFRSSPTRLELGDDLFTQKITLYREKKNVLENEYGPPEYVNLRIPDRIYFKPAEPGKEEKNISQPEKEER